MSFIQYRRTHRLCSDPCRRVEKSRRLLHVSAAARLMNIGMAPLCTRCGRRPARPHFAVGYFRHCVGCNEKSVEKDRRRRRRLTIQYKCLICGIAVASTTRYCSPTCRRAHLRQLNSKAKADVLHALGGRCACQDANCWHVGPCTAHDHDVLTVDHTNRDGWEVRRRRQDGTIRRRNVTYRWPRYRRALTSPDHGMQLLCYNCHHVNHNRFQRAHLMETSAA